MKTRSCSEQLHNMWQLSMGPNDEPSLLTFLQSGDLPRVLSYPKGRANMKVEPAVGDRVVITCKGMERALGIIQYGFHQTQRGLVANVIVTDIVYEMTPRRGQRRNWTQL